MKIRVVYDSSTFRTSIVDADTGQVIHGVRTVKFEHTVGGFPTLTLEFIKKIEFEANVDGTLEDVTEVGDEVRRMRLKSSVAP